MLNRKVRLGKGNPLTQGASPDADSRTQRLMEHAKGLISRQSVKS